MQQILKKLAGHVFQNHVQQADKMDDACIFIPLGELPLF